MKWIGQHIWDFISRFRSDVYLEGTETGTIASGGNLGLDANNKIVKADTETGELSFDGNTADGVLTYKDADEISVESNLTFNNEALVIGAGDNGDASFGRKTNPSGGGGGLQLYGGAPTGSNQTGGDLKVGGGVPTGNAAWGDVLFLGGITGSSGAGSNISSITTIAKIKCDSTTTNNFYLYEPGTPGLPDYCKISTAEHGATTISTGNNGGSSADLTLDPDGKVIITETLTMGSTDFVNNSGVVQVATQGTIDHDSLANFVANEHIDWTTDQGGTNIHTGNYTNTTYTSSDFDHNSLTNYVAAEHYRWDNDNSGTATIHTNNITDLHGAGVDGTAGSVLTDAGNGQIADNPKFTYDGTDLTISSLITSKPKLTIENNTVDSKPSSLSFYKNRSVGTGTDGDVVGKITFDGKDHLGNAQQYAVIQAQIVESNNGDEAGLMELKVASSTGTASSEKTVLKGTGSASDNDVDVEIGFGSTSMTTVAGNMTTVGSIELGHASDTTLARSAAGKATLEGVEIQLTNVHRHFINFGVNLSFPYSRYLPIGSYYISEQNTDSNPEYTTYVVPYDGRIVKAIVRSEEVLGETSLTFFKVSDGTEEPDNGTTMDTKSVDIAVANTAYTYTFDVDSDAAFTKGQALSLRIDPHSDPVGAGVVGTIEFEFDLTS